MTTVWLTWKTISVRTHAPTARRVPRHREACVFPLWPLSLQNCWVSVSHIVGLCEWVSEWVWWVHLQLLSSVDCWKRLRQSIVLDINFRSWLHVAPPSPHAPLLSCLSWHTDYACSMFGLWFSCSSTSVILVSFPDKCLPSNTTRTTAQLSAISQTLWPTYHCLPFSHTGRVPQGSTLQSLRLRTTTQLHTTVSAVSLRAYCRMGKNDLKDKMVCRLVCDGCNMCGVDVYHLPPSFSFLSALFFLLPSPPSSLPLSSQLLFFPLFLSGSDQSLAQTFSRSKKGGLVFWVIFLATWDRGTLQFENV